MSTNSNDVMSLLTSNTLTFVKDIKACAKEKANNLSICCDLCISSDRFAQTTLRGEFGSEHHFFVNNQLDCRSASHNVIAVCRHRCVPLPTSNTYIFLTVLNN